MFVRTGLRGESWPISSLVDKADTPEEDSASGRTMAHSNQPNLDAAGILSLRIFVAVAEARSFSAAARQLRLSPSAVTNHVLNLEGMLGVALFHRTTRRVTITAAGELFYEQTQAILNHIDDALQKLVPSSDPTGHIRVIAPPAFAVRIIGPNLGRFLNEHPGVSVDVIVSSATPDIIADRIDVAFLLRQEIDSKAPHQILSSSPRVFCATPDYLERHGTPQTPRDLLDHRCLSNMVASTAEPWAVMEGKEIQQIHVKGPLLSDNGSLIRSVCLAGSGIGNFYRFHVGDDLRNGDLVEVLREYQPNSNKIFVLTPHRRMIRPLVQIFIDFVGSVNLEMNR